MMDQSKRLINDTSGDITIMYLLLKIKVSGDTCLPNG